MASEEGKDLLLLLLPLLLRKGTIYTQLLNLHSFTLAAISSFEAYCHATTIKAFEEHAQLERWRSRPTLSSRPKQGGQRITEEFLLSLDAKACLYYFRYVILYLLIVFM